MNSVTILAMAPPPGTEGAQPPVAFMFGWLFIMALLFLLPGIFYLISLQRCLNRCKLENRTMQPALVWLMLIPIFNLVWHFIIVSSVSKSVEAEFRTRGIRSEPSPGNSIGLAMCILAVCSIIPLFGILTGIAGFICWIIYWVKIAGISGQLAAVNSFQGAN